LWGCRFGDGFMGGGEPSWTPKEIAVKSELRPINNQFGTVSDKGNPTV